MRDGNMVFPPQRQSRGNFPRNDFPFPNPGYRQMPPRNNPLAGLVQQFLGRSGPNVGQTQNVGQMASRGVEGLSKTLNGVQQVLRVVDTATPLVKQYGPLVRNLPAMYRMMKAFNSMESTDAAEESNELESLERESISTNTIDEESPVRRSREGQSTPKLFI